MKNAEQSAFPTQDMNSYYHGLTKREYFAGLAMQGLLANSYPDIVSLHEKKVSEWAIAVSDELLKQLEK